MCCTCYKLVNALNTYISESITTILFSFNTPGTWVILSNPRGHQASSWLCFVGWGLGYWEAVCYYDQLRCGIRSADSWQVTSSWSRDLSTHVSTADIWQLLCACVVLMLTSSAVLCGQVEIHALLPTQPLIIDLPSSSVVQHFEHRKIKYNSVCGYGCQNLRLWGYFGSCSL